MGWRSGAALHERGFHWSSQFVGGRTHLVITDGNGGTVDRETVRSILAAQHRASLSGPDIIYTDVRFEDEPPAAAGPGEARTPGTPPVPLPGSDAGDGSTAAGEISTPVRRRSDLGLPLLHATYGCVLLAFPQTVAEVLVRDADEGDRAVVRLLGGRHLVQAFAALFSAGVALAFAAGGSRRAHQPKA